MQNCSCNDEQCQQDQIISNPQNVIADIVVHFNMVACLMKQFLRRCSNMSRSDALATSSEEIEVMSKYQEQKEQDELKKRQVELMEGLVDNGRLVIMNIHLLIPILFSFVVSRKEFSYKKTNMMSMWIIIVVLLLAKQGQSATCSPSTPLHCTGCFNMFRDYCQSCTSGYNTKPFQKPCFCSLSNCANCDANPSICTTCNTNYVLISGACILCSIKYPNCATCGPVLCTACANTYYLASPTSCILCSIPITNCVTCTNPTTCTTCTTNYVRNSTVSPNRCVACSAAITNCVSCSSMTVCVLCATSYGLNTVGPNKNCLPCNSPDTNCNLCVVHQTCTQCITNYYFNATSSICVDCLNVNCLSCTTGPLYPLCTSCVNSTYTLTAQTCTQCPLPPNCAVCSSSTGLCVQCIATTYYLDNNSTCQPCTLLPGCSNCTTIDTCINCTDQTYFNNLNRTCILCSLALQNCIKCVDASTCIECVNNSYYIDSTTNKCTLCSVNLASCSLCSNSYTCTQCINDNSIYMNTNSTCSSCSSLYPHCVQCIGYSRCTLCTSDFYLNSLDLCTCINGTEVDGICILDQMCTSATENNNTKTCTACATEMHVVNSSGYNPINCQCDNNQFLVTNICTDIFGCIAMIRYNSNTQKRCLACNLTLGLYVLSGSCGCQLHYEFVQQSQNCSEVCGDGVLIYLPCDDGNLQNGDGCSSTCLIQKDYTCGNGSLTSPSNCIYNGKIFTIMLTSIHKTYGEDIGIFQFQIYPSLFTMESMNLTALFSFVASPAFTINSITLSSGVLVITVHFTQNLQTNPAQLIMSLNETKFSSKPVTYNFSMISNDYKLILSNQNRVQFSIKMKDILMLLALLALLIFVVNLPFHKMVGVQTLQTFQIVYFLKLTITDSSQTLNCMNGLDYSTGYGKQFFYNTTTGSTLGSYFFSLQLNKQFILNEVVILGLYLISFVVFIAIFLYIKCQARTQSYEMYYQNWKAKQRKAKDKACKRRPRIYNYLQIIYKSITFPIIIAFSYSVLVSLIGNQTRIFQTNVLNVKTDLTQSFNSVIEQLNTLTILIALLFLCFIIWFEVIMSLRKRDTLIQLIGVEGSSNSYVQGYLIYTFCFVNALLYLFNFQQSYMLYATAGMVLAYLIILLIYRPYKCKLHNFGIIFNQISVLSFACCLIYRNIMLQSVSQLSDEFQFGIVFVLVGSLTIVDVIGLIRVIFQIRLKWLKYKQEKYGLKKDQITNQEKEIKNYLLQNSMPKNQSQLQPRLRLKSKDEEDVFENNQILDRTNLGKTKISSETKEKPTNVEALQNLKKKLKQSLVKYLNNELSREIPS